MWYWLSAVLASLINSVLCSFCFYSMDWCACDVLRRFTAQYMQTVQFTHTVTRGGSLSFGSIEYVVERTKWRIWCTMCTLCSGITCDISWKQSIINAKCQCASIDNRDMGKCQEKTKHCYSEVHRLKSYTERFDSILRNQRKFSNHMKHSSVLYKWLMWATSTIHQIPCKVRVIRFRAILG